MSAEATGYTVGQRVAAEALGTGLLVATVVGSGIMAEKLSAGNGAVALLCNTIPTGAILYVLITMLGPVSEGLRLAEMAYLSEGQIPEEVGHGAVL